MNTKIFKSVLLYIFIAIIPAFLGSAFFFLERAERELDKQIEEAKWVASIHESHWNVFIRDTITSLEMLSLTARTLITNYEELQPLLERAQQADPRYGGLFLINPKGEFITGSNKQIQWEELTNIDFISEVSHAKNIIISDQPYLLENEQEVISLSAPILNQDDNLLGVIVALIRIDYVENIMNILTPERELLLLNNQDEVLIEYNIKDSPDTADDMWITVPIDSVPWVMNVKVNEEEVNNNFTENLLIIIAFFISTHIIFLLIKYLLLRRQAAIEKRESDIQKLKLVGSLAASTAHEIRNPLTGIKGLVQLLEEKHQSPEEHFYFSVINKEIERINQITSEFLILSKPAAQNMKLENMVAILRELVPIISSEAMINNVKLVYNISDKPIYVLCAKDQMKQVILNIAKNAFEALEEGGTLSISLSANDRICELSMKDNGVGIGKDSLEKIFDPFYTSKESGTGLGLFVCQRILESFGGEIQVSSKVQEGTLVKVLLPLKNG